MKVKVVLSFKDKHTKAVYQKGQEIEVIKERFEELTSAAQVPLVEQMSVPKKTSTQKKSVTKNAKK